MAFIKEQIAMRIAKEIRNNTYGNLGIGIPTLVANYIPEGLMWCCNQKTELGMGPFPYEGEEDADPN